MPDVVLLLRTETLIVDYAARVSPVHHSLPCKAPCPSSAKEKRSRSFDPSFKVIHGSKPSQVRGLVGPWNPIKEARFPAIANPSLASILFTHHFDLYRGYGQPIPICSHDHRTLMEKFAEDLTHLWPTL